MSVAAAQKRRKILIAAVAAVVATGVFLFALSSSKGAPVAAPVAAIPTTKVVAVEADLPALTKLTLANLKLVDFPATQVTSDNILKIEAAVDRVNLVQLPAGTVLLKSVLVADYVNPVSMLLKKDDVAIAIPFAESTGFGGYVRPEDRIHILCDNGDGTSTFCFQNVRVIEVGGQSQSPTPAPPAAVVPGASAATPQPSGPAAVANANVLVVELSRTEAALVKGILAKQPPTGKGTIIGYALVSSHNTPPPSGG